MFFPSLLSYLFNLLSPPLPVHPFFYPSTLSCCYIPSFSSSSIPIFFPSFSFLLILLHFSSPLFSFIPFFLSLSITFPSLHCCLKTFSLSILIIFPFISSLLIVPFSSRHMFFFTLFSLFLPSFPPSLAFLIIHSSFESLHHSSLFLFFYCHIFFFSSSLLKYFFLLSSFPFVFLFSPSYIPFHTLFLLVLRSFPPCLYFLLYHPSFHLSIIVSLLFLSF